MESKVKEIIMSAFASGLTLAQMLIPSEQDKDDMKILTLLSQKHFAYGYAYFAIAQYLHYLEKEKSIEEINEALVYLKSLYNSELNDIIATHENSEK